MLRAQIAGTYRLEPWPWPILTHRSRSLLPGSVTLVCGSPGAGKTWFTLACMRFWAQRNIPSAVLMLEENTAWHMHRFLAMAEGNTDFLDNEWVRSNPDTTMEAEARHGADAAPVEAMLTCQGNLTLAACVDWVEKQCDAGKRIIVIDPITLADPGSEKSWDADRRFMQRAQAAIGKSGSSLVLVTHPRKAAGQQKGPQTLDDLAGGAA
jgi:predicted ATP-dependent serine protease